MQNLKISTESKDEIAIWKNLQNYPAWKRVIMILKERVDEADKVINMIGGDRSAEFSQRDVAIIKKNSYLDLIELPEQMINTLSGTGTEPVEEMDPFLDDPLPETNDDSL